MDTFQPIGSTTLLNQSGDVTIVWSEEHEAEMRKLIEKKLSEGYAFFKIEKKAFGLIKCKEKITSIDQIQKGTELLLRDEDAIRLFNDGKVRVKKNETKELVAGKSLKDVDEIIKNDTLAVRPIAAG